MTILCYHSVEPDWEHPLAVHPTGFARHCAWVASNRRVVGLGDGIEHLDRRGRLPRGTAVLTFDDGFSALYDHVLPVLQRHRLPATVFLVAATLTAEGQPVDWVDDLGAAQPGTLSLEQVLEMQDFGVDFQSHSFAHRNLPELGFDDCVRDLRESRELLEDLLGKRVDLLAYPRGLHDEPVRRAAERAGYRYALTLPEGPECIEAYAIPRVGVYRGNGMSTFRAKCCRPYLYARTDPRAAQVKHWLRTGARPLVRAVRRN